MSRPARSGVPVVVLAAGGATRMGAPKQALPYRGGSLVRTAVVAAMGLGSGPVVVVMGAHALEVRAALDGLPVSLIEHLGWAAGIGGSIAAGTTAAEAYHPEGVLFTLADQPFVTTATLRRLLDSFRSGARIAASRYAETVGVPALFHHDYLPRLRRLPPQSGCKSLLHALAEEVECIDCPEAEVDIDTPEEYARLTG